MSFELTKSYVGRVITMLGSSVANCSAETRNAAKADATQQILFV
jgi:hypothetical protein